MLKKYNFTFKINDKIKIIKATSYKKAIKIANKIALKEFKKMTNLEKINNKIINAINLTSNEDVKEELIEAKNLIIKEMREYEKERKKVNI